MADLSGYRPAMRRFLKLEQLEEIPKALLPKAGPGMKRAPVRCWLSSQFSVQLYGGHDGLRLSVSRVTVGEDGRWEDGISWDELQRVKEEAGFGDRWAVEVFPPTARLVDVANMRHLWLLPEAPPYGWNRR